MSPLLKRHASTEGRTGGSSLPIQFSPKRSKPCVKIKNQVTSCHVTKTNPVAEPVNFLRVTCYTTW